MINKGVKGNMQLVKCFIQIIDFIILEMISMPSLVLILNCLKKELKDLSSGHDFFKSNI